MARGMQDFWINSAVDIFQQTLSFMSQRPYYGDGKVFFNGFTLSPSGEYTAFFEVEGRGRIYALLWGFKNVRYDYYLIKLLVDGEALIDMSLKMLTEDIGIMTHNSLLYYTIKNDIDFLYALCLGCQIQFEESFYLGMLQNHPSDSAMCHVFAVYALAE